MNATALNPTGVLRVSASLSFALQHIAPRLPDYTRQYPNVRVHVEAANRYLDLIDNGIDVAIRTREFEPDSNITIRRLAETRRILAASPAYLKRHGRPAHPADLRRHALLLYVYANNPYELTFSRGPETIIVPVEGLLESNDGQICGRPRSRISGYWSSRPTSSTTTSPGGGSSPCSTIGTCRA